MSHNPTCVLLLLDRGCSVDFVTKVGWIPLHSCCYVGSGNDIIDEFLRKGSGINKRTRDEKATSLILAVQENHVDVTQHLVSRGAKMNLTDMFGRCALHVAVKRDNHRCLQRLLELGADYTIKMNSLENILHYAAQWAGIMSLTILHGSNLQGIDLDDRVGAKTDIQSMDVKGLTALEIAERRRDVSPEWLDMFRKLIEGIRDPRSKTSMAPIIDGEDEFHDALETPN